MENHTKRIRKARRQGLQRNQKDVERPTPARSRLTRRNEAAAERQPRPVGPRASQRKSSATTTRKTKPQRPAANFRTRARIGSRSRR